MPLSSIFSLGTKAKQRLTAEKFYYNVTFHSLQPWIPASGNRSIAIGWQRGQSKKGSTRSVCPTKAGRLGHQVRFNEKIDISASLYRSSSGTPNTTSFGCFRKKCLVLAILETDGRTDGTFAVGRVVIDLAEFAAIDNQETRAFEVTCSKDINQAVGTPSLLVTIRTSWKKARESVPGDTPALAGAGDVQDDSSSISSNTTGSRMTSNIGSLVRPKFSEKWASGGSTGQNDEQDLQGFELGGSTAQRTASTNSQLNKEPSITSSMVTIKEDQGEPENESAPGLKGACRPIGARHMLSSSVDSSLTPVRRPFKADVSQSNGADSPGPQALIRDSPRSTGAARPSVQSTPERRMELPPAAVDVSQAIPDALQLELLCAAANEICVLTARMNALRSAKGTKTLNSAARRLARSLVSLAAVPEQAISFGFHMLKLIASQLEVYVECGLLSLAFWWTNLVQLRVLLTVPTVMQRSLDPNKARQVQVVAEALIPHVVSLEQTTFHAILNHVWAEVTSPALDRGDDRVAHKRQVEEGDENESDADIPSGKNGQQKSAQAGAVNRWIQGLDDASRRLGQLAVRNGSTNQPHLQFLRQQILEMCLKRLDALLFFHLLVPAGSDEKSILAEYDPTLSLWGSSGQPMPSLKETSLPFQRGLLSFGSGMSVKLMVTRFQQWAAGSSGVFGNSELAKKKDSKWDASSGTSSVLFPLLRATADLLMMPKELLLDAPIRADVTKALTWGSILYTVERFQPDEFAGEPVSTSIIQELQRLQVQCGSSHPLIESRATYKVPAVSALALQVQEGAEAGLEYSAESEDELLGSNGMASELAGNAGGSRYHILHRLWSTGVR